ncbi:MAG: Phosphohistidine phosphatase SixA [Chlamydiae bacterium]|nr:Phosphohistidine phosphatase SixA [Chlamydiota bacterium]
MKRLILMRHAIADDHFQGSDMSRPLTLEGQDVQLQVANYMHRQAFEIDGILYSPFLRAEQSAQIILKEYPDANMLKEPALGNVFDSFTILKHLDKQGFRSALIIGHAPTLSAFGVSLLEKPQPLKFEKSGVMVLDFSKKIDFGQGSLVQKLSPKDIS